MERELLRPSIWQQPRANYLPRLLLLRDGGDKSFLANEMSLLLPSTTRQQELNSSIR